MQKSQMVATWIIAIALTLMMVRQFVDAPQVTTYQTIVASFPDENLGDALTKLGPLGWRFTSCRRASMGELAENSWGHECFLERVTRTAPDDTPNIIVYAGTKHGSEPPDDEAKLLRANARVGGCASQCVQTGKPSCVAAMDVHCEQSDICKTSGACKAVDGACVKP